MIRRLLSWLAPLPATTQQRKLKEWHGLVPRYRTTAPRDNRKQHKPVVKYPRRVS